MRKRKHPRPNQRRQIGRSNNRRRKIFMNLALGLVALMALSLVITGFGNRLSQSLPTSNLNQAERAPASQPSAN